MPSRRPNHQPAVARIAAALLATAGASALAGTYQIDNTHTSVMFEVRHYQTSTVRGRWDRIEGSIDFDASARSGRADIVLHTGSLIAIVPLLESVLKGESVLDVARHPQARFTSEQFRFDAGGRLSALDGTLTLMGRSQPVTLQALHFNCYDHPRLKREVCGGDFEARITRSAWGIGYGIPVVPDEVRLVIQIEAIKP